MTAAKKEGEGGRKERQQTRVSHLPKVLLHAKGKDAGGGKTDRVDPKVAGFEVRKKTEAFVAAKVGDVQTFGVELVDGGEEFPGPCDGLGLKVVTKGPVAEHLKEGVMIRVFAHIIEIVVLSSCSDALLRVCGALQLSQLARRVRRAQEDGLELVHARVGKLDGRVVVWNNTRRPHKLVSLFLKERDER